MVRVRLPVVKLRYEEMAEAAEAALLQAYMHSANHHFPLSVNLDNPNPIDIDNIGLGNRGLDCH